MLGWALTFLAVALVAALLGYSRITVISTEIAQVLFIVFIVLFVVAAIVGAIRGRSPPA